MARSVGVALRGRSVEADSASEVLRAVELAMEPRRTALEDDHHPAFLHPGRSVLVLLHDVEALETDALALAALHESEDPELRVSPERVRAELGARRAEAAATLPLPGADTLAETLVVLPRGAGLAVLAERLDHLRHLHMRPERAGSWQATFEEVEAVWRPFAARVDDRLAVRYAHWSRTFARRLGRQFPRV
jgi:hypothetical protein